MEVIVSEGWKDVAASQGDVRNQQRPVIALTKSLQEDCPCYCLYAIPGQFPPGVSRPLVHLAGLEGEKLSWAWVGAGRIVVLSQCEGREH